MSESIVILSTKISGAFVTFCHFRIFFSTISGGILPDSTGICRNSQENSRPEYCFQLPSIFCCIPAVSRRTSFTRVLNILTLDDVDCCIWKSLMKYKTQVNIFPQSHLIVTFITTEKNFIYCFFGVKSNNFCSIYCCVFLVFLFC